MAPIYHFEHVHILSKNPKAVADYFHKMFDAKVIEAVEPDGTPRVDVEMNGVLIFIFIVRATWMTFSRRTASAAVPAPKKAKAGR